MRILGIETSCDDTGVAIYDSEKGLLAHALYSQIETHADYGGVVPELASRDHIRKITSLVQAVMQQTELSHSNLHGIAYTAGPGLPGALMVGAAFAKSLAMAWQLPSIGVHHMEGHLLAVMLEAEAPSFPFLALLVSGGHTQLVEVTALGCYKILGESIDDAVGEAFDKTAKLLGLGYPGGAALSRLAEEGDMKRFHFPRPMTDRPGLDFSFSGLKTCAVNTFAKHGIEARADIARAFQEAVIETLLIKSRRALDVTGLKTMVVAGGVGANKALRAALEKMLLERNGRVYFPRPEFCTDNGAMIAYVGCQRFLRGQSEDLAIKIYPRWVLDELR